jgi:IMP cyclohydrolase
MTAAPTHLEAQAAANAAALAANRYPGRGIVAGLAPDARHCVIVYWTMGRSENSRNRIFVDDGDTVRTAPFDASRVVDPSLIIYNCVRIAGRVHLVSNGDHTDTLHDAFSRGVGFTDALATRTFEPDPPNYTPRIAAAIDLDAPWNALQVAVLKAVDNDPARPLRCTYGFGTLVPGIGHFVSTYRGDGEPLPAFAGEPQPMPLLDTPEANGEFYWQRLDAGNRVSLLVRHIDRRSGTTRTYIVNRHGGNGG